MIQSAPAVRQAVNTWIKSGVFDGVIDFDAAISDGNATQPVGTGPYRDERWSRGSSLTLVRWDEHRDASRVALQRVTWRFISDASAQVAALLAGDVDAFARVAAARSLDFGNFARPGYYWNYESAKFNELWAKVNATADTSARNKLMADLQRLVADDAVLAYLYQPTYITVAKAGLKGLPTAMPVAVNDLSSLSW